MAQFSTAFSMSSMSRVRSAPMPDGPVDSGDLAVLDALRDAPRAEVAEISRRAGLTPEVVRARLHRLQRAGVLRGCHAVVSVGSPAADDAGSCMVMLRFAGADRGPDSEDLRMLPGVSLVHVLCGGWGFLLQMDRAGLEALGLAAVGRGSTEILGVRADYEVLPMRREYWRKQGGVAGTRSDLRPLA